MQELQLQVAEQQKWAHALQEEVHALTRELAHQQERSTNLSGGGRRTTTEGGRSSQDDLKTESQEGDAEVENSGGKVSQEIHRARIVESDV